MRVLLCPWSSAGYLYPATALALELHRRGHDVALVAGGPAAHAARAAGIWVRQAPPAAFDVADWFHNGADQYRAVVELVRETRPDVLVASVLGLGTLLAARMLDLPVVVLGLTCHLWPYAEPNASAAEDPEQRGWRLAQTLRIWDTVSGSVGLAGSRPTVDAAPLLGTAFLLRGHPELETPGRVLPAAVRHVGPLWWEPAAGDETERQRLAAHVDRVGKPLAYVHLGRTFGGESLWSWIETAFRGSGYQAVVELGRSEPHRAAPGVDVLTVRRPWMSDLLQRAELVVTNGTTAPVLGALLHGRPLFLRPNGGEQRVLAAACVRAGVAERLPDPAAIENAVLGERARMLGAELRETKSAALAAQAVEAAAR
ncbi:MAG TPA: glycosyltransferase [Actinospica sp.]|jgi:UDP:flavonoid glycosyltransferase YjiC (YdhE family)|nr:glycosyltransferase [Actinospica sp.]